MTDIIDIEILEDGMLSVKTEGISGTNHKSADELLEGLFELAGGEVIREKNPAKKQDVKVHEHVHAH